MFLFSIDIDIILIYDMDRLGGSMDNIYIQKGVRKIYNNDRDNILYVTKFDIDVRNRDGYCIDSRNVDSFFYGYREDYGYRMSPCCDNIVSDRMISFDELDRGYIRLDKFIEDGEFIGREFRRLCPVITYYGVDGDYSRIIDNRYLKIDGYNNKYVVLYMKDNMFLVKYICGKYELYGIIDCRYIQDGMYEFIGDIYLEYMDRDMVYLDIVKQIDDYCKNDIKKKMKVK